jgi:hypothetical protein
MTKIDLFFWRTRYFWSSIRLIIAFLFLFVGVYSLNSFPLAISFYVAGLSLLICIMLIYIARKEISKTPISLPIKIFTGIFTILLGLFFGFYGISSICMSFIGSVFLILSILLILYGLYEIRTAK